jgi:hypothetical protein
MNYYDEEPTYKYTTNLKYWENHLDRKLSKKEMQLLGQTRCENNLNDSIKQIYEYAKTKGLYLPILTSMDGNCMFESLKYFGLCENIDELRIGLAMFMLTFKNIKDFSPNPDVTLNELFTLTNEITHVFCWINKKVYKYNFDAMCVDLATNGNWSRLNTELILRVMSMLLNLRFFIHRDMYNSIEICHNKDNLTKDIYLGQIDDTHYIPLDVRKGHTHEDTCPEYTEYKDLFHEWAIYMSENYNSDYIDD